LQILVCIDDTDNIESRGTGELAEMIRRSMEEKGWGKTQHVTRHQLLLHPDIPYTSHNSSMCFQAEIEAALLPHVISYAEAFLARECQQEADPGLCVLAVDGLTEQAKRTVINFGYKAKKTVLTKAEAYDLANQLEIHLSEHGGTGQGVIGALAGAGLRLSNNDGWFKGDHKVGRQGEAMTVQRLLSFSAIDQVKSVNGACLPENDYVVIGNKLKTVLLEGKAVILVYPEDLGNGDFIWKTCEKKQLREYEAKMNCVADK